jgi:hypothetical protein
MKTIILAVAVALTITPAHLSFANEISSIRWPASNLETLNRSEKSSIDALVNELNSGDPTHAIVGTFGWYDLRGDGHYDLVVTEDLSGARVFRLPGNLRAKQRWQGQAYTVDRRRPATL